MACFWSNLHYETLNSIRMSSKWETSIPFQLIFPFYWRTWHMHHCVNSNYYWSLTEQSVHRTAEYLQKQQTALLMTPYRGHLYRITGHWSTGNGLGLPASTSQVKEGPCFDPARWRGVELTRLAIDNTTRRTQANKLGVGESWNGERPRTTKRK
jgi:hypothetical protein